MRASDGYSGGDSGNEASTVPLVDLIAAGRRAEHDGVPFAQGVDRYEVGEQALPRHQVLPPSPPAPPRVAQTLQLRKLGRDELVTARPLVGRRISPTSTSNSASRTRSLSRSPSRVRGRCRPGVSMRISWLSAVVEIPPDRHAADLLDDVIATFCPTKALVSVDLPRVGSPHEAGKSFQLGMPRPHLVR